MRLENLLRCVWFTKGLNGRWGLPLFVKGLPGAAKTSRILQASKSLGLPMETVIASLREPSDFLGLPVPNADGSVHYLAARWASALAKAGRGVAFFDEIPTAPPSVQAALLRTIFEGVVGDLALPPGIRFVAAGNPVEFSAGGHDLSPPLANRFIHLSDLDITAEDWSAWMMSGEDLVERVGGDAAKLEAQVEKAWAEPYAKATGLVVTFLKRRNFIHKMPTEGNDMSGPWPSPRTWSMATRALAGAEIHHLSVSETDALLIGCVGLGAAKEFAAFRRDVDLPDPADVLDGRVKWKPDERLDRTQAVFNACTALVCPPDADKRMERAKSLFKIMTPLAKGHGDLVWMAVRSLIEAGFQGQIVGQDAKSCFEAVGPALQAAGLANFIVPTKK